MKKLIAVVALIWAAMVIVPVIAGSPIPFQYWPALYQAANDLVVKRGQNLDGTTNDKIYLRIGWGPCLAVYRHEFNELFENAQTDRYINLRDYAEQRLAEDTANIGWGPDDDYNCPLAPLVVKPYRTGSRPVYYRELDEERELYVRGAKSPYRVRTDGEPVACQRYGTAKDNGDLSNYWMLDEAAELYHNDITILAGELSEQVVVICEEQDVPIEDHRF